MTAVAGDPQALRAAARTLSGRAISVQHASREVGSRARLAHAGWQGTAAVRFVAASDHAVRALRTTGARLGEVAGATERYATELEAAQRRVVELERRQDSAEQELRRRRHAAESDAGAGSGGSGNDADLQAAAAMVRALAQLADGAAAQQAAAARCYRDALERAGVGRLESWVGDVGALAEGVRKSIRTIKRTASTASFFQHLRYAAKSAEDWVRVLYAREAGEILDKLLHGPAAPYVHAAHWIAIPARVLVKATPPLTLDRGLNDLLTGGGYSGWRGTTTRVLGGLAALGAAAAMTPAVVVPQVGIPAAVFMTVYDAWKTGNWIYDHRSEIAAGARSLAHGIARGATSVVDAQVKGWLTAASAARSYYAFHVRAARTIARRLSPDLEGVATLAPGTISRLRGARRSGDTLRRLLADVPKPLGPVPLRSSPIDRLSRRWRRGLDRCRSPFWPAGPMSRPLGTVPPLVCTAWSGASR